MDKEEEKEKTFSADSSQPLKMAVFPRPVLMKLKVKKLSEKALMPKFAHDGDACFDLSVIIDSDHPPMIVGYDGKFHDLVRDNHRIIGYESEHGFKYAFGYDLEDGRVTLESGCSVVLHTGLKCETERGYNMKVHVRSSTGIKKHLMLSNGTGVIDTALYRGEILIGITNVGRYNAVISDGERVAQAEIVKTLDVEIEEVDELTDTVRGEGGFGSTGGH